MSHCRNLSQYGEPCETCDYHGGLCPTKGSPCLSCLEKKRSCEECAFLEQKQKEDDVEFVKNCNNKCKVILVIGVILSVLSYTNLIKL